MDKIIVLLGELVASISLDALLRWLYDPEGPAPDDDPGGSGR
jgi:hypothetical protein